MNIYDIVIFDLDISDIHLTINCRRRTLIFRLWKGGICQMIRYVTWTLLGKRRLYVDGIYVDVKDHFCVY